MKAPDKLVFNEALFSDIGIFGIEDETEYIRKDALLEWAEEKLENMKKLSPSDGARIYSNAINDLVDKLNQM